MKPAIRLGAALLAALPLLSHAITLDSRYGAAGGSQWTVALSLSSQTTLPAISEFTVYFGQGLFSNLSVLATPASWSSFIAQPDAGIPAAGFVDYLVSGASPPLGQNQSLGGLSLAFTYLGSGTPGSLRFEVVDPATFAVLFSGQSTVSVVPEPAAGVLALAGLAAVAATLRRTAA